MYTFSEASFTGVGGSTNPCQDTYSGSGPASEVETEVLVNYLRNNAAMFDAYITVHSYGQYWLYPWGYTTAYPTDREDLVSGLEVNYK